MKYFYDSVNNSWVIEDTHLDRGRKNKGPQMIDLIDRGFLVRPRIFRKKTQLKNKSKS